MRRLAIKVWEFPVRLFHWTNFLAIVVLSLTGAYIHWPFLSTPNSAFPFLMGWARAIHFVAGWVLMVGLVGRLYWAFVGNRYARLSTFFPYLTRKGWKQIWGVLRYYLFLARRMPSHLGHNAIASTAYGFLFLLLGFQVVTGFALLGQADLASTTYRVTGWVFDIATNQWVRLGHYFAMWVIFAFFITHIYAMWMSDLAERDGTAGSMFSGYKYGEFESFADTDPRGR
ncbi:MAG: Ni/Fe-hydrogenase, b-type cytochrome subunit [Deltaproteobacteria bacterium]|nr:Ni/Fe-hydrogenase, b-type cytochrome subunit [Deltaproteobacteria bacterium]